MPSNKQRRDAERLRLQRQLDQRREREVERRRFTLIASIVGTLVAIAAIVTVIVVVGNGDDSTPTRDTSSAQSQPTGPSSAAPTSNTTTAQPPTSSAPPVVAPKACATPAKTLKGTTAMFDGTTVMDATDITKQPTVTSAPTGTAKSLECGDVKIGTGKAASPTSTVKVQYTGFLYSNGTVFDASYLHGKTGSTFPLNRVVPGFTQGIGGTGKVAPMRVGGVRIMILPPSLGYGSAARSGIPANSTLVFVVALLKVK